MRKILKIIYSLGIIMFNSCSAEAEPEYCRIASDIMYNYMSDMSQNYDLIPYSSGGGFFEDIEVISIGFNKKKNHSISEVRKLFITLSEELIDRVNMSEEARPYLHNYPFASKNIEITLGFHKENQSYKSNEYVNMPYVALAYNIKEKDRIFYNYFDTETGRFMLLHEEDYSEALKIVQEETKE